MYHARRGHDSWRKESGDRGARADADVSVDDGTAGVGDRRAGKDAEGRCGAEHRLSAQARCGSESECRQRDGRYGEAGFRFAERGRGFPLRSN